MVVILFFLLLNNTCYTFFGYYCGLLHFKMKWFEVITLVVFVLFSLLFFKNETFRLNHLIGFVFLVLAVYFIFKK